MSAWFHRLHSWRPGRLARNTVLATFWQGVRIVLQFAYLVLVARMLGAEGYGLFSEVVTEEASWSLTSQTLHGVRFCHRPI